MGIRAQGRPSGKLYLAVHTCRRQYNGKANNCPHKPRFRPLCFEAVTKARPKGAKFFAIFWTELHELPLHYWQDAEDCDGLVAVCVWAVARGRAGEGRAVDG